MLTLYTSKLALLNDQQRPNIHLIQDANAYFNQKVRKGEIGIEDCRPVQQILCSDDMGRLKDMNDMLKLSTSCKTLILARKYPDMVYTTSGLTKEAATLIFLLFCEGDQSFIYYLPERVELPVGKDGAWHEENEQTFIGPSDEIEAEIISEETRTVVAHYGEIMDELNYWANRAGQGDTITSWKWNDSLFDEEEPEDSEREPGSFSSNYYLRENLQRAKEGWPTCSCNRTSCIYHVELFPDCFVVGGKYIISKEVDREGRPHIQVHSPFGTEPSAEQYETIFDYAEDMGYLDSEPDEEEAPAHEISQDLYRRINQDFRETHLIDYYVDLYGTPQIYGITYYGDKSSLEQDADNRIEEIDPEELEALFDVEEDDDEDMFGDDTDDWF